MSPWRYLLVSLGLVPRPAPAPPAVAPKVVPTAQQQALSKWQDEIGARLERMEAERRLYQRKTE